MRIDINQGKIECKPSSIVGQGGEAVVYDIGGGIAFKLFKPPSHPDFLNDEMGKKLAEEKIEEHQSKIPDLLDRARDLPQRVVCPIDIGRVNGRIVGYSMPLLSNGAITTMTEYSHPSYRNATTIGNDSIVNIFRDLHQSVKAIHDEFVIGDFNDLNILVVNDWEAHLIDVDSWQFSNNKWTYKCKMYTTRFVDPGLCDENQTSPVLVRSYNKDSDWYSYGVMLFQSLLLIDPFGGVYKPADRSKNIPHDARRLQGISVFDAEVKTPKHALPIMSLPDEILHHFEQIFSLKRLRGEFPIGLIDNIRWTKCLNCGLQHARHVCPVCSKAAPAVKETRHGTVTAKKLFRTSGNIMFASHQDGKMLWLFNENGKFTREDGRTICEGSPDPKMRFRFCGKETLLAKGNALIRFEEDGTSTRMTVDKVGDLPIFDANSKNIFWIEGGYLNRNTQLGGKDALKSVLDHGTHFWVGEKFGFGFYTAGEIREAFLFDAEGSAVRIVEVPDIKGQMVDSTCFFSSERCWFIYSIKEKTRIVNRCTVMKPGGEIIATANAEAGDGSWLGTVRGKVPTKRGLFSATDEGLVLVGPEGGSVVELMVFPDTEPFVDESSHLFQGPGGSIHVVGKQEILLLNISS